MAPVPDPIADAYRSMADVGYRPAAPTDGYGNITVPEAELDLEAEVRTYRGRWERGEKAGFEVGYADPLTGQATVYTVEAARRLCAVDIDTARQLLNMAVEELDRLGRSRGW